MPKYESLRHTIQRCHAVSVQAAGSLVFCSHSQVSSHSLDEVAGVVGDKDPSFSAITIITDAGTAKLVQY